MDPSRVQFIAESWAAVLGVTPFIDGGAVSPSVAQSKRVQRIEREMRVVIKAFLRGRKLTVPEVRKVNFDKLAEALKSEADVDKLAAAATLTQDVSLGLMKIITDARTYLVEKLPRSQKQTAFGLESQRPGANLVRDFRTLWVTVDGPLEALRELTLCSLTTEMVTAIKRVFPSLYNRIVEMVIEELAEMKAVRKDFSLPRRADRQLEILLGTTSINGQVGAAIQRLYATAREKDKPQPQGGGGIKSGTEPSAGQRIAE